MTITAFNEAIRKMSSLGATVLETPLPNAPGWNYTFVRGSSRVNNGTIQIQYDLKTDIADTLQTRRVNSGANTLQDVINFTIKLWDLESPEGQCCFPVLVTADQLGDRSTSGEYWLAKNTQARLYQEGPAVLFEKFRLDVLVLPTESSSSRLGAVGRLPVGSVPLGYDDINPPFGMAFVGRCIEDGTTLLDISGR
ncbi:hypothetical protein N7530_005681 [Penicillium desertorum]|uniref:Amidase domain-containing protein n=1 Tax=Penicillium desertorum TaxID=1303715 RepID=A0A9X0BRX8_9EURO|nr:hypothetical protein N7530_005681 [Penicillium desertorum]